MRKIDLPMYQIEIKIMIQHNWYNENEFYYTDFVHFIIILIILWNGMLMIILCVRSIFKHISKHNKIKIVPNYKTPR